MFSWVFGGRFRGIWTDSFPVSLLTALLFFESRVISVGFP